MDYNKIISQLPYTEPFLFVDGINHIDDAGIEGHYTFDKNAAFYRGHFKDHPVTPGVLLTECMAQIGVVCLGIYLIGNNNNDTTISQKAQGVAMSSTAIEFYKPVFPGEKVTVISEKIYFRFQKLKCKVRMLNEKQEVVALGEISGMIK